MALAENVRPIERMNKTQRKKGTSGCAVCVATSLVALNLLCILPYVKHRKI